MDEQTYNYGQLTYRVRGLTKNSTFERLHINLLARHNDMYHVDALDLYSARQRSHFIKCASIELEVPELTIKRDLGQLLLTLEELQSSRLHKLTQGPKPTQITPDERQAAIEWLKQPDLIQALTSDIAGTGLIGETNNALIAYLAATSRKLPDPLSVLIQSSSAAGKSSLMDSILALFPPEDVHKYTTLTPQTLYYLEPNALKHRILAIAEDNGAANAAYALKLLQSDKQLTLATTEKDKTGNMRTKTYKVEGPTSIFMTTTAHKLDPELMNRCLVLSVDESAQQTQQIHAEQRKQETLSAFEHKKQNSIIMKRHHVIQRTLEPMTIINPHTPTIHFDTRKTRSRRDHKKLLMFIRAVTFLHQYQRPQKKHQDITYIETTLQDIEIAQTLFKTVIQDEDLSPQTHKLLKQLQKYIEQLADEQQNRAQDIVFTRRFVREWTGYSADQVRYHLHKLVELEIVRISTTRKGQATKYVLIDNPTLGTPWEVALPDLTSNDISDMSTTCAMTEDNE